MTRDATRLVRIDVEDPCESCGSVFVLHRCTFTDTGGTTLMGLHLAAGDDYYFPYEAGKLAGCGTLVVMAAIHAGELRATKWCGRYVIPKGALLEWLETRDADGAPL